MSLNNLGKKIKHERQLQGITQEQLAEKADISVNFMSLIEGGRNMSVETLVNIASALGVTVDYLLSDVLNLGPDEITTQICNTLSGLSLAEKQYFLNIIKQYKNLDKQ